jgi:septin family protein
MNPNTNVKMSTILDELGQSQAIPRWQKPIKYMNVLFVGEAFRGKSDLIKQIFFDIFQRQIELEADKVKFGNFEQVKHEDETKKFKRVFHFVDSRGFLSGFPVENWYKSIKDQLQSQMKSFYEFNSIVQQNDSLKKKQIEDMRYHLCVYLLKFPDFNENDLKYMIKLQKYINVLPVVVIKTKERNKYSLNKIEYLKRKMQEKMKANNLNCFNWSADDDTFHGLENKLIARTLPLVIQLRDFKSVDYVDRPINTDFHILANIFLNSNISIFKLRTEQIYNMRLSKILSMKKKDERNHSGDMKNNEDSDDCDGNNVGFGAGVAVGLGLIGAFMAFKNKLF